MLSFAANFLQRDRILQGDRIPFSAMEPSPGSSSSTKLSTKAAVESVSLKVPMGEEQGVCSFRITASAKSISEESLVPGSGRAAAEITFRVYMDSPISSFGGAASELVEIVEKQPIISDDEDKVDSSCFRRLLKVRVGHKAFKRSSSGDASAILQRSDGTSTAEGEPVMGRGMEASVTGVDEEPVAGIDETASSGAFHSDTINAPEIDAFLPHAEKRSSWVGECMRAGGLFSNKKDEPPSEGVEDPSVAEPDPTSTSLASHLDEGEALEGGAPPPQARDRRSWTGACLRVGALFPSKKGRNGTEDVTSSSRSSDAQQSASTPGNGSEDSSCGMCEESLPTSLADSSTSKSEEESEASDNPSASFRLKMSAYFKKAASASSDGLGNVARKLNLFSANGGGTGTNEIPLPAQQELPVSQASDLAEHGIDKQQSTSSSSATNSSIAPNAVDRYAPIELAGDLLWWDSRAQQQWEIEQGLLPIQRNKNIRKASQHSRA